MSDISIQFGTNRGWECPKCGRVYAPWMSSCAYCGVDNNVCTWTTNVQTELDKINERGRQ